MLIHFGNFCVSGHMNYNWSWATSGADHMMEVVILSR